MVETASNMLPLGTKAPDFTLHDTISNTEQCLSELKSDKGTVIMFICNHCPYVLLINQVLVEVAKRYQAKGISFVAISSNDAINYPQDGPIKMHDHAITIGYPFPYLYDDNQSIAKAYKAACTPDFYLFDQNLKLVYRGQFDNARPGDATDVTGEHLTHALDKLLQGKEIDFTQKPSLGCNIKWK